LLDLKLNQYDIYTWVNINAFLFGDDLAEGIEMGIRKVKGNVVFQFIILSFMIVTALGGCAMGNYGRLVPDEQVLKDFEAYQALPGYNYYYRGSAGRPFVVAGILEEFNLNSKLWVKIDPNSKEFGNIIERVSLQGGSSVVEPWGFNIIDQTGRKVGIWYSAIRGASIEVNQNNQIVSLAPTGLVAIGNQPK
jgi:hypothetical protein